MTEWMICSYKRLQESMYLRKNLEHLRQEKRYLERQAGRPAPSLEINSKTSQVDNMEARLRTAEAQKEQYKALFEVPGCLCL